MSADLLKERLHLRIEQADDKLLRILDQFAETLFSEYHNTENSKLGGEEIIGYQVDTNEPILASEADDTFQTIVDDVKAGNYIEVDDLIVVP